MKIDLKNKSRKELEKIAKDVEKALEKLRKKDLKKARMEMEKIASAHGVSVDEVLGNKAATKTAAKKSSKAKVPAKYANPSDPSQTWSGRGRQPLWFKDALSAGKDPGSMEI